MSVTFQARLDAGDWAGGTGRVVYESPEDAELNVSQANALTLLRLLGYVPDHAEPDLVFGLCPVFAEAAGDADPADFLGRVLIAEALAGQAADDSGRGWSALPGLPNHVDCGRPAGYLTERLAQLRTIAEDAAAHNAMVVWG